MTYDEGLAQRIREQLRERPDITEKRMFGGLSFLLCGHMSVGVVGDELIARVGPDRAEEALARPEARPMDFTGRPMRGWVTVGGPALAEDSVLRHWVTAGLAGFGGGGAAGRRRRGRSRGWPGTGRGSSGRGRASWLVTKAEMCR
ncbi:TfoX/Sxy family protein [Streptomyces sp. NPDC048269]|uniref:TfoX/Sxy family protein n=1 Tax=Streptomyces sp. NPDC048269 TaxID=3155753 RepID=UPI00341450C3